MQQVQRKGLFRKKERERGLLGLESLRERNPKVWNHCENGQGEGEKKKKKNREIVGILRICPQKALESQEKEILI